MNNSSDRQPEAQRLAKLRITTLPRRFSHCACSILRWVRTLPGIAGGLAHGSGVDRAAGRRSIGLLVDYRSPLSDAIERIRGHIEKEGKQHGWEVRDEHLDNRHLVRRIVLKRVIYGVDLNPMAVSWRSCRSGCIRSPLARRFFWIITCAAAIFCPANSCMVPRTGYAPRDGTLRRHSVVAARNAAAGMQMVEELTDADIAEVNQSKATFGGVEEATEPLYRFLNLVHGERWLDPPRDGAKPRARRIERWVDRHP